jgi:NitT/TauT family transport system substrate-binding protein
MYLKKRIFSAAVSILMVLSLTGCGQPTASSSSAASSGAASSAQTAPSSAPAEKAEIRVAALKGPTGLSMVKLMEDSATGKTAEKETFSLFNSPDEVTAKLVKGEADVAAVPTNLAAVLYAKTNGKIRLASVTTLGVLFLLENGDSIKSIADLKGKTVAASGKGATPEYALNYILSKNGLTAGKDVSVEYRAEHAALAAEMIAGKVKTAVLPEPFVTQVLMKNKNVRIALNLTNEWKKAAGDSSVLTMGCLVVRSEFAEKNKTALDSFLNEYKSSAEFANGNVAKAAELSGKYSVMDQKVALKAIPNCSIVYLDGEEMKAKTSGFLKILAAADPKSVGGKLPDDAFYYQK